MTKHTQYGRSNGPNYGRRDLLPRSSRNDENIQRRGSAGRRPSTRRGQTPFRGKGGRRAFRTGKGRVPLDELPKHDLLKIHTSQIKKAKDSGDWQHALKAYEWLLSWGVRPDRFVFNAMISALSTSSPSKALLVYRTMVETSIKPDATTLSGLISAYGRLGEWELSLKTFRTFVEEGGAELKPEGKFSGVRDPKGFVAQPLEVLYNTLITACGLSAKWELANSLFKEMQEFSKTTVISYGALMVSYEKAGKWEESLALLDTMVDDSIQANTIIYNTAIFSCVNGGKWEVALSLYSRMKEADVKPSYVTFIGLIQGAGECDEWEMALQILDEMNEISMSPRVEIANAVMNACIQGGVWELALEILGMMEGKTFRNSLPRSLQALDPSSSSPSKFEGDSNMADSKSYAPDVISYNTILNACVQIPDWRLALELFHRMESRSVQPDIVSYNTLIKVLGESNKPLQAEKTFARLQSHDGIHADTITYNTLIKAFGDSGDWVSALEVYRDLRDNGGDIRPDCFTYNQLLQLLDYAGQADPAHEVASDLFESPIEPDAFTFSILATSRSFDTSVIAKTLGANVEQFEFDQLYEAVKSLMDKFVRNKDSKIFSPQMQNNPQIVFNSLIGTTKNWEKALSVMQDMETYGVKADAVTFDALINVYVRAGQWTKARQMLRTMNKLDIAPNALTFSNVINACVARGQWVRTIIELERTRDSYRYNFLAYNVLMAAYSNGNRLHDAIEIYQKMLEVQAPVNVVAYASFLRACARNSQWEDAITIMHHMRESAVRPSPTVQNQLVLGMVFDGALNEAMQVLELMRLDCAPVTPQTFQSVAMQLRGLCLLHTLGPLDDETEDEDVGDGSQWTTAEYMQNLSEKLASRDVTESQCTDIASLLEEISLDNPVVSTASTAIVDEDLEIWGGELENENQDDSDDDEIGNFVRFVKGSYA